MRPLPRTLAGRSPRGPYSRVRLWTRFVKDARPWASDAWSRICRASKAVWDQTPTNAVAPVGRVKVNVPTGAPPRSSVTVNGGDSVAPLTDGMVKSKPKPYDG